MRRPKLTKEARARPNSGLNIRTLLLLNRAYIAAGETAESMQFSERSDPRINLNKRHRHRAIQAVQGLIATFESHCGLLRYPTIQ